MIIRRFCPGDEPALLAVFRSAVRLVAVRDYSAEQIEAWAPMDVDLDAWGASVRELDPLVAELAGLVVGFADLQPHGFIDRFFVSGYHARLGIGDALMARLLADAERQGMPAVESHVSKTAQPFFARHGFELVEQRRPIVRGVALSNALMRRQMQRDRVADH